MVVAGARGTFLLLVLEIPPPLDRDLLVVGRGWLLLHEGSSSLVWSRTDRGDAGICTSLSPDQWEPGVRYTLRGRLSADDTFVVSEVARSSLQNPLDIGLSELRVLGCAGRTPLSIIIAMSDQWADTPLDTLAVFATGEGGPSPADPDVQVLLGELTIVRWMTAELSDLLREMPIQDTFVAYPILANDKKHLLPW